MPAVVVVVLGTVAEIGFGERVASFVGPVWEQLERLVVALVPRRYQTRTRSCCPLARLVASRCWAVSIWLLLLGA